MLLAVMDLIQAGQLSENRIYYDNKLKDAFTRRFEKLRTSSDHDTPYNPYYYLSRGRDAFWHHQIREGRQGQYETLRQTSTEKRVTESIDYAYLDTILFEQLKSPSVRTVLRSELLKNLSDAQRESILVPAEGWTWDECELVVTSYLDMLRCELEGVGYSVAKYALALQEQLSGKEEGDIRRMQQNISAILMEAGMPILDTHRPIADYQHNVLPEVVAPHLAKSGYFEKVIESVPAQSQGTPDVTDILNCKVEDENVLYTRGSFGRPPSLAHRIKKVDYLEREIRMQKLGLQGEEFIVDYEKAWLKSKGRADLSKKVVHASKDDDSLGYDIESYNLDETSRLIEVKTTNYSRYTPFYVTKNELHQSKKLSDKYYLYRVFTFRRDPRFFLRQGDLRKEFEVQPYNYTARPFTRHP